MQFWFCSVIAICCCANQHRRCLDFIPNLTGCSGKRIGAYYVIFALSLRVVLRDTLRLDSPFTRLLHQSTRLVTSNSVSFHIASSMLVLVSPKRHVVLVATDPRRSHTAIAHNHFGPDTNLAGKRMSYFSLRLISFSAISQNMPH